MAKRIIWSNRAKIARLRILEYFAERNGNKTYSRKLYNKFNIAISKLNENHELGRKTDFENVRCLVVLDFGIFYRVIENDIEIITIWDFRRDPNTFQL